MIATVIQSNSTALLEAVEENLHRHVAFLQRQLPGMRVIENDDLLIVDSGMQSDTFNKILRARLHPAEADRRIVEAIGYFRGVDRPFSWWVGPCSRPLDLEARLHRHGLRAAEYELGMTIDLANLPPGDLPSGFSIRPVGTRAELADFATVLSGLSEPPDVAVQGFFDLAAEVLLTEGCPMRLFVAYSDAMQPAAVSELFIGGGLAGIHMVATAEAFRLQGLGMALTRNALEEGRRLGLTTGALQASEAGQGVYEKLGFRACGRFVEYH